MSAQEDDHTRSRRELEQSASISLMNARVLHSNLRVLSEHAEGSKKKRLRNMVIKSGEVVNELDALLAGR